MDSRYIYHWKKTSNYVWGHSPFWDPKSCHVEQNPIDVPWTSHEFPMNSLSFASEIPIPHLSSVPPRPPKPSPRQRCCDVPQVLGDIFLGGWHFLPCKFTMNPYGSPSISIWASHQVLMIQRPQAGGTYHIFGHMNCGDIPWNLGLKNRPYIW